MRLIESHDTIEQLFAEWKPHLGAAHDAYKGHVYRVFNFCRPLIPEDGVQDYGTQEDIDQRIAIAASFHDVGIWLTGTMDYLSPSRELMCEWLRENDLDHWTEELELIVEYHHKITQYRGDHAPLVEAFRKADLVDVYLRIPRCGLSRDFINEVRAQFPDNGFHMILVKGLSAYGLSHPWNPLPMMRR